MVHPRDPRNQIAVAPKPGQPVSVLDQYEKDLTAKFGGQGVHVSREYVGSHGKLLVGSIDSEAMRSASAFTAAYPLVNMSRQQSQPATRSTPATAHL